MRMLWLKTIYFYHRSDTNEILTSMAWETNNFREEIKIRHFTDGVINEDKRDLVMDLGITLSDVSIDIDGNARDVNPDIGANEFN